MIIPTTSNDPYGRVLKRHTYPSSEKNNVKSIFAFSMHTDSTAAAAFPPSPTPNDIYIDGFHKNAQAGSGSLLYLDDDDVSADNDGDHTSTGRRKTQSRSKSKKKKKRNGKILSSDSHPTKSSICTCTSTRTTTSVKRKSNTQRRRSKSKTTSQTSKRVVAMLEKLDQYEETIQEECCQLQKEREAIALECETLQLKSCELESKLDEVNDVSEQDGSHTKEAQSSPTINNDALRVENSILKRRLQRQVEIILQLSNSQDNLRAIGGKKDISQLEKQLSNAKELICKNEKIIKGQKLTIDRLRKEASTGSDEAIFPISMVGSTQRKTTMSPLNRPYSANPFSSFSSVWDSWRTSSDKKSDPSHQKER